MDNYFNTLIGRKLIRYSRGTSPKLDKELYLEEYKSLREEILQRINILTQITGFILTAWAFIVGTALEAEKHMVDILLMYPLLSFFTSYSWAFNNTRIFQIANYLKCREEDVVNAEWGLMYWESHIQSAESYTKLPQDHRTQGYLVFIGTEILTLVLACIIKLNAIKVVVKNVSSINFSALRSQFSTEHARIELLFFVIGIISVAATFHFIQCTHEKRKALTNRQNIKNLIIFKSLFKSN